MSLTRPHPAPAAHDEPLSDSGILSGITAGLAEGGDLGALLQRFLDPVVRLAGAQAGAVRLLSACNGQLELVGGLGLPADMCSREQAVDRHCGACGVAADGQPMVWSTDLSACAERTPGPFFSQQCHRMLAVPLQHRGRVLGVYNLFFSGGDEPGPAVQSMLRSVGELLGLALNHARLEQEQLRASVLHERQTMAAELHDTLAQSITYMKMRMPLLKDALLAHDQARALQHCDDVRAAATQAHASLRSILTHFRAPMDPLGLAHALDARVAQFRRDHRTELEMTNRLPVGRVLSPEQEAQVFHIVDEALQNVARHSGARRASLLLQATAGQHIEVVVEDDGAGLAPQADGKDTHYGLQIMNERARRLGGRLEVGTRPGGGTRVRLCFAWSAQATSAVGA